MMSSTITRQRLFSLTYQTLLIIVNMSWFKDFTDKVQSALPKIDNESFLQSLTLTTPELTAERERIDADEKRKEHVRSMLAGMLPWQTRDPERDLLVEECKEAILLLSKEKSTFFGPYTMPQRNSRTDDDEDGENEKQLMKPSEESIAKLAKLEPLPSLLDKFEFLAHVGLIEKILAEDPRLVKMQSTCSGTGHFVSTTLCRAISTYLLILVYLHYCQVAVHASASFGRTTFFTALTRATKPVFPLTKYGPKCPTRNAWLRRRRQSRNPQRFLPALLLLWHPRSGMTRRKK